MAAPADAAGNTFALTEIAESPEIETVCMAFPEYIGLVRFIPSIDTTSCTTEMSLLAAILATRSLDCGVAATTSIPAGDAASIAAAQEDAS